MTPVGSSRPLSTAAGAAARRWPRQYPTLSRPIRQACCRCIPVTRFNANITLTHRCCGGPRTRRSRVGATEEEGARRDRHPRLWRDASTQLVDVRRGPALPRRRRSPRWFASPQHNDVRRRTVNRGRGCQPMPSHHGTFGTARRAPTVIRLPSRLSPRSPCLSMICLRVIIAGDIEGFYFWVGMFQLIRGTAACIVFLAEVLSFLFYFRLLSPLHRRRRRNIIAEIFVCAHTPLLPTEDAFPLEHFRSLIAVQTHGTRVENTKSSRT